MQLAEAHIEMVKAGYCMEVISKWAVEPYLKTKPITAIPVSKNGFRKTWCLASLKKDKQPEYYRSFIRSLAHQMKNVG